MTRLLPPLLAAATILVAPFGWTAEIHYVSDEQIVLVGEIAFGDADRFESLMFSDPVRFLKTKSLSVNTPGGDLSEALRIAELIEEARLAVIVPEQAVCASACFVMYAAAAVKLGAGTVAVHRPFLPKSAHDEASLAFAVETQQAATQAATSFLRARSVPEPLIQHMVATPSTEAYTLSAMEILESLGIFAYAWEEVLIQRCNISSYDQSEMPWECIHSAAQMARVELLGRRFSPELRQEAVRQLLIEAGGSEVDGGRIILTPDDYPPTPQQSEAPGQEANLEIEEIDMLWERFADRAARKGIEVEDPGTSLSRLTVLYNQLLPLLARRGDAEAAYRRGVMAALMFEDYESSLGYMQVAVDLGELAVLPAIGDAYRHGLGAPVEKPRALAYYWLAEEYGFKDSYDEMVALAQELSHQELEAARRLKMLIQSNLPPATSE